MFRYRLQWSYGEISQATGNFFKEQWEDYITATESAGKNEAMFCRFALQKLCDETASRY